jgi:hypothetical protein
MKLASGVLATWFRALTELLANAIHCFRENGNFLTSTSREL